MLKDYELDILSGKYVVNAKSIMGIFSLDLSKPINMHVHSDDAEKIEADLQSYITKALESEENE